MEPGYVFFNALLVFLYFVLSLTGMTRFWKRLMLDREFRQIIASAGHRQQPLRGGPRPTSYSMQQELPSPAAVFVHDEEDPPRVSLCDVSQEIKPVLYVYGALIVYADARWATLLVTAMDKLPPIGSMEWNMALLPPAFFLTLLQSALIYRWMKVTELLSISVQRERSRVGTIAVVTSLFVCIMVLPLSAIGYYDCSRPEPHWRSDTFWSALINIYNGGVYVYNGVCFLVLGFYLGCRWSDMLPASLVHIQRRVLAIAIVFGLMCVARGLTLLTFFAETSSQSMNEKMKSDWGIPTILLLEWSCIATVVFVLGYTANAVKNSNATVHNLSMVPRTGGTSAGTGITSRSDVSGYESDCDR